MSFIKVYFDDRPLWITDDPASLKKEAHLLNNADMDIKEFMKTNTSGEICFVSDHIENAKDRLFRHYKTAMAGGGLVKNKDGKFLLIYRRNRWDLPKGHLDEGETMVECALREVREETGLKDIRIVSPLIITYHTYARDGEDVLKETHWYLMDETGDGELIAQTEEDIQRIEWVLPSKLEKYYPEMFPLIRDVLDVHFLGKVW